VTVFTLVENRSGRGAVAPTEPAPEEVAQPWWKALLPPLPIVAIFLMMPGVFFPALPAPFEKGLPVAHAMIGATIVVLLLCRGDVSQLAKKFCEGLGYAYANIITLIVTASCFIAGLTEVGLTDRFVKLVAGVGWTAKLAAGAITGLLAIIAGTGIGPSVAFSKAVLPTLRETNLAGALDLGALAAIAATFGRTMSPVAAVVIFCATFGNAKTIELIKHTAPPLLAGFVVMLAIMISRG
jgi:DcuC family C4-dicarboxylate transporter